MPKWHYIIGGTRVNKTKSFLVFAHVYVCVYMCIFVHVHKHAPYWNWEDNIKISNFELEREECCIFTY